MNQLPECRTHNWQHPPYVCIVWLFPGLVYIEWIGFVARLGAKLQGGLIVSTRATIGLSGYSPLAIHALTLCTPALLTVLLILRLRNRGLNRLVLLWDCSVPDFVYLYMILYFYVILLGLMTCE